jgi:hypothetical protein
MEMANTDLPAYNKVNPLVHLLDTIKPCGCCEDECDHDDDEYGHGYKGSKHKRKK